MTESCDGTFAIFSCCLFVVCKQVIYELKYQVDNLEKRLGWGNFNKNHDGVHIDQLDF